MALKPENPVVGGTNLRRQSIRSPNYVPGVSGWTINQDGSAEFNNLTIRGTFFGTNFILNSTGLFLYSGPPALGNLAASAVPGIVAVIDPEGNTAQPGITSYGSANLWAQLLAGALSFQNAAGQSQLSQIIQLGTAELAVTSGSVAGGNQALVQLEAADSALGAGTAKAVIQADTVNLSATTVTTGATTINAASATAINFDLATIDLANGNLNLNMADPPNTAAVIAGTATQAQYNACLGGMLNSMKNRKLFA